MLLPRYGSNTTAFAWLYFLWIALAALAVLIAGITSTGSIAALIAFGAAIPAFLLVLLQFRQSTSRDWIFAVAFPLPFAFAVLLKLLSISMFGLWQISLMILAPLGAARFWKDVSQARLLQWFLGAFFFFMALGVISTLTGRSHLLPAAYQLISDCKPVLLIVLGYALCWDSRQEGILGFVIRWFWLPALFLIAFEWAMPGAYFNIFPALGGRASPDPSGIFPSRAVGPFEHPSFLATTAATFLILSVSRMSLSATKPWLNWYLAAMYLLLLIFAVQRQELVAAILAASLVFLISKPESFRARVLFVAAFASVAGAVFWIVFSENITREAALWGFGTVGPIEHPRAQIFSAAAFVADRYFPFGAGLGTFAGAGAEKFDTSLYEVLGFRNYWWYGHEDYLMDTYWPNSIAETGLFGAISLLMSYLLLFAYAIKCCLKSHPSSRPYWAATAGLMAYMLMLSFSSPAFQDSRLFVMPALMFGIASTVSRERFRAKI
jgi:O-antigen ligase